MQDKVCGLCGIRFVDGSYRFAYRPDQPVHPDAVYSRVCKSAIEAQKKRVEAGEDDLAVIRTDLCINTKGAYNPKYRWIANPTEAV